MEIKNIIIQCSSPAYPEHNVAVGWLPVVVADVFAAVQALAAVAAAAEHSKASSESE
jgi:hypothetical protein